MLFIQVTLQVICYIRTDVGFLNYYFFIDDYQINNVSTHECIQGM